MSYTFDPWALEQMAQYANSGAAEGKCGGRETPVSQNRMRRRSCKKVSFGTTCSVVLIPCLQEYHDAGINLWFDLEEYQHAKQEAAIEIQEFMTENPSISFENSVLRLHQPANIYDREELYEE